MKFPRLSNVLAALIIVLFTAWVGISYQSFFLAAFALLGLCARRPSYRCGPFDNTVAEELTLARILDTVLEGFVSEVLALRAFSLGVTNGKTLNALGTKKVRVAYIPAVTAASKDFNAANGDCYETDDTATQHREIEINRRKYQSWGITSEQSATEPVLNSIDFARLKGQKLANDVMADILSVVDDTNFPNESAVGLASAFDTDILFDVREDANGFKMPKLGRSAILTDPYETSLLKDNKDANVYGNSEVRWDAQMPRIAGMNIFGTTEGLDGADDVDAGIVVFPSAILVANAPLQPHPKILPTLVDFQVITHEESGLSLVYKAIADPKCDNLLELVECTYGKSKGEAAALLRLVAA